MRSGERKQIPADSLLQLRQRLDRLPIKSSERASQVAAMAHLYGVSPTSVYRALHHVSKPHAAHRADYGKPRLLPSAELKRYCELVAALKLRTTNKDGRHLSTQRAIELLEGYGVETAQGLVQAPQGLLTHPTVNRYLSFWHLDQPHLTREPAAVRFQAEHSHDPHTFKVMPQRWVVECGFAWLEKCRRLWKNGERKLNTSLQLIHLAFLALLLRRS